MYGSISIYTHNHYTEPRFISISFSQRELGLTTKGILSVIQK